MGCPHGEFESLNQSSANVASNHHVGYDKTATSNIRATANEIF